MKILRLILDNLKRGTLTAKFPEKQPVSPNYRGMVSIDSEKCVGCGQCAYSCPSCAMEVHREGDKYQWKYDARQVHLLWTLHRSLQTSPAHHGDRTSAGL